MFILRTKWATKAAVTKLWATLAPTTVTARGRFIVEERSIHRLPLARMAKPLFSTRNLVKSSISSLHTKKRSHFTQRYSLFSHNEKKKFVYVYLKYINYFLIYLQPSKEGYASQRPRSNTVSEGTKVTDTKVLPTVFKWEGGGKQVYISGTFTEWKTLPMVKSHGDFVTIIDLPEGEHQYKFYVDGEWRHDPGLVRAKFLRALL